MQPFSVHTGIVAPLDRANVDTDAIIPKQFLKKTERTGFGRHLFHEWRYLDYDGKTENPEFVLNRPAFRKATILLTRENFGCGSSREHAPWALTDYGFRAVIASGFADIFYNNSIKNGLLLVRLAADVIEDLMRQIRQSPGAAMTVDLENTAVTAPDGKKHPFVIQPFARHCLLNGLDQIDWTMQVADRIAAYEEKVKAERPWLA